jgi:hypothetical protein
MKIYFFTTLIMLMSACSAVQISSDFDRDTDFASYKSYAFTKEAEQLPVGDINRKRIMDAIATELAAKGFSTSEQPDVLIDLNMATQQKQTATATSTPYGAGYAYGWGRGFSTTTIDVENYVEGTLFVDMIDASKKQLVWQGRALGTIDPSASASKREANINSAVKQIFTTYPPKK